MGLGSSPSPAQQLLPRGIARAAGRVPGRPPGHLRPGRQRPRGGNPSEDDRLGRDLLGSVKDRHEHAFVVDGLRTVLAPVCQALDMPAEPRLHKLRHVQHLITPICASAANDVQLLTLLQRLHPTAAVGGLPRDAP
jgi:isochorismate synthase EntC